MASRLKGKAARVVLATVGVIALGSAGAVSAMAANYRPLIAPGTEVCGLQFGGLDRDQAKAKLQAWWDERESTPLDLKAEGLKSEPTGFTASSLGVTVDVSETVARLPLEDFWSNAKRRLTGAAAASHSVSPVVSVDMRLFDTLSSFVNANIPDNRPARAYLKDGQIVKETEQSGLELDENTAVAKVQQAIGREGTIDLPLTKSKARVSDSDLEQITEVVSSFTSRYNEGNANRASNIKNAAERLTGTILMPGETFSFNKTLGQRTAKNGFKLAGVYNNGKHDFDIGGGICQVSGTLYNAVLLANLKIAQRSCHTFPVPYLPVGRDATVSFPAPDFAFTNSYDVPIAVSVEAGGGQITFSILGKKQPGLEVKLETAGHTSWSRPVKVVNDPSLPPGRRVVEEPGGAGHKITTFRLVYMNGELQKRENLGVSIYNGGQRIVRANLASKAKTVTEVPGKKVDNEHPDAPPPTDPPTIPPTHTSQGGG